MKCLHHNHIGFKYKTEEEAAENRSQTKGDDRHGNLEDRSRTKGDDRHGNLENTNKMKNVRNGKQFQPL